MNPKMAQAHAHEVSKTTGAASTLGPSNVDPSTSLMELPEEILRIIVLRLDMKSKQKASQVSKDFRRLLVTDADNNSWGRLAVQFGTEGGSAGSFPMLKLDPSSIFTTTQCLRSFFEGGRSRRFSELKFRLPEKFWSSRKVLERPLSSLTLVSAAQMLRSDDFQGKLIVFHLQIMHEGCCNEIFDMLEAVPVPMRVGWMPFPLAKIESPEEALSCMQQLTRLASMKHVTGIDILNLYPSPHMSYSALLSCLRPIPIQTLRVRRHWAWNKELREDWDTDGMSLTQVGGLNNTAALSWVPRITSGDVSALCTISGPSRLDLAHCTPGSWPGLSDALTALTTLSALNINMWDGANGGLEEGLEVLEEGEGEASPLASLGPLRLPASVSKVELWFRLPMRRKSLSIDVFGGMGHVATLTIAVVPDRDVATTKEGIELLRLTLGSSLGALSSLKSLKVDAWGPLQANMAIVLPSAVSTLSNLKKFATRGCMNNDDLQPSGHLKLMIKRRPWS